LSQDISKDPRILMVEYALKQLKEMTINKRYKLPASKENTLAALNKLNSTIKAIKYSYLSPSILANNQMISEFQLMVNQFCEAITKHIKEIERNKFIAANLKFIFSVLKGFKNRLKMGDKITVDKAIDIIAVKVISVVKVDAKQNLFLCRVGDGEKILNVITNLPTIKKEMIVPVAILPPRDFGTEISEAMFCGVESIGQFPEKVGEYVHSLPQDQLKEVNHLIINLLKES